MKVYFDTNVAIYAAGGGRPPTADRRDSRRLLRFSRRWLVHGVASPFTLVEIWKTPNRSLRRRARNWLRSSNVGILPAEWAPAVAELAHAYLGRGVVPAAKEADALHLAWASLAQADALASWNRNDLVRLKTRVLVAMMNAEYGLRPISVELPREVLREVEGR